MFRNIVPGEVVPVGDADRYNALNHLLNSRELGGVVPAAAAVPPVTVAGYNRGTAVIGAGTPVTIDPGELESWEEDVWQVAGYPVAPAMDDSGLWGIAAGDIPPGGWGGVTIHGLCCGKVADHRAGDGYAVPQNGQLVPVAAAGRGRLLKRDPASSWAILYLGDAAPAPGYNGYFKIINADGVIKVVDGATYNSSTGSSGKSRVMVNNVSYEVPAATVTMPGSYYTASVVIKFTAPVYNDAGRVETAAKVEIEASTNVPSSTSQNSYYQIGRVIKDPSGTLSVFQDHTSGVPQMWWFTICQ